MQYLRKSISAVLLGIVCEFIGIHKPDYND
jgi:hypothetical protein